MPAPQHSLFFSSQHVIKRRNRQAGRRKQEREQEANKDTHIGEERQPTIACQQHHTSGTSSPTREQQNSNPRTRPPHLQETRTPPTQKIATLATKVAARDRRNTSPPAGKAGTPPRPPTQRMWRLWGIAPAAASTPRHNSTGAQSCKEGLEFQGESGV